MSDTFSPTKTQIRVRTKAEYVALRDALEHYYARLLGLSETDNDDGSWVDSGNFFKWNDRQQFLDQTFDVLYKQKSPPNIDKFLANKLYVDLTNHEIEAPKSVEFKEADASPVNSTLPTQEVLSSTEEVAEKIKQQAVNRGESNRRVREALEKQKNQAKINIQKATVAQVASDKQKVADTKNAVQNAAELQKINTRERLQKAEELVNQKHQDYLKEAGEIKALQQKMQQKALDPNTNTDLWLKVRPPQVELTPETKILNEQKKLDPRRFANDVIKTVEVNPLLKNLPHEQRRFVAESVALEALKDSNDTSFVQAVAIHEVVSSPNLLNKLTQDAGEQAKIKSVAILESNKKLAQYEMWRQYIKQNKNGVPTKVGDVKVVISETEPVDKTGYTKINAAQYIDSQVLDPHRQSITDQDSTLRYIGQDIKDRGLNTVKSRVFEGASKKFTQEMGKHAPNSALSKFYNHDLVQASLSKMGVIPSSWTSIEGNWVGNYLVSSGYGDLAGYFQQVTGISFGVVQASSLIGGELGSVALSIVGPEVAAGAATAAIPTAVAAAGSIGGELGSVALSIVGPEVAAGAATAAATTATAEVAATTGFGALIGSVPGLIIGAVVGLATSLLPKIKQLIDNNREKFLVGGLVALGLGFGLGSTALMASGAISGLIGGSAMVAAGSGLGSMFASVAGFFGTLATATIGAIGGPILATLLVFPVVVTLILFIINSGAYVVPLDSSTSARLNGDPSTQSPYIDVEKKANPPGPFQNNQLPITIEYTVKITGKKDTLTEISIQDTCKVIAKDTSPECPAPDKNIPADVQIPESLTPGQSFSFTYKRKFTSNNLRDSVITDTVAVTAKAGATTSAKASASASIIIGTPPTGCFTFDNSWNAADKARETLAINKVNQATVYMSTICKGPPITLKRVGSGSGCGSGGGEVVGNTVNIYDSGVNCSDFVTFYTLAHETGHIYSARTDKYRDFEESGAMSEGLICTYPNELEPSEDFAEMIALYYTKTAGSVKGKCMSGTVKTAYPLHWKFAHDNIFMENLGW